jgi:hypothetical protein
MQGYRLSGGRARKANGLVDAKETKLHDLKQDKVVNGQVISLEH